MDGTHTIALKNVSIGYRKRTGNTHLLKNLSLEFSPGDCVGIVGLNGVGKSTFLKTVCGLLTPLSGDILIGAQSIKDLSLNELAQKITIVLTEKISGFNLTAFDAVAAGQMPYTDSFNRLNAEHIVIIEKAIALAGIEKYRNKLLNELSDGMFQKTMIAKTLAQQTQTILLDEPTAFLDYASKHELFLLLKNLCEMENKCVLVSCHDLDLILKYCNKIAILTDGNVELIEVSEALNNKNFTTIGGGYL